VLREFCFYGRGGQGAVTAAQILATAVFSEGRYSQTFPKFGMERRGAPLLAFLRIDDEPIEIRGKIFQADGIVVLDSKLLKISNPIESLKKEGFLLVNSKKPPEVIKRELQQEVKRVFSVDASAISSLVYGPTSIPITSVILLGSFAAMTQEVKLNSLFGVLKKFFRTSQLDSNRRALELGHEQVRCLNED